jgi:hypothetical protein
MPPWPPAFHALPGLAWALLTATAQRLAEPRTTTRTLRFGTWWQQTLARLETQALCLLRVFKSVVVCL